MDIVKAKGLVTFSPNEKAPDFVLGTLLVNVDEFIDFLKNESQQYQTEYQGKKQLKIQVTAMKNKRGIMVAVDTWKPTAQEKPFNGNSKGDNNLPF